MTLVKLNPAPILGLIVRLLLDMLAIRFLEEEIGCPMAGVLSTAWVGLGEEIRLFFELDVFPKKFGVYLISGSVKRLHALLEFCMKFLGLSSWKFF